MSNIIHQLNIKANLIVEIVFHSLALWKFNLVVHIDCHTSANY